MTSECHVGWQDTNIHSVSSLEFKMLPLSVVISFIISRTSILLGVPLDVGEISKVAEDIIISVVSVMSRRFVVAENENIENLKGSENLSLPVGSQIVILVIESSSL